MKFVFVSILIIFSLTSCANVSFLIDESADADFLKNKTTVYVSGWESSLIKEILFLRFGEVLDNKFLLKAEVSEKQIKRSVSDNQVAKKTDYQILINYDLSNTTNVCPNIINTQTTSFSFTPKSSGYNFASDVLFKSLLKEAISKNLTNFISFANKELGSLKCINES